MLQQWLPLIIIRTASVVNRVYCYRKAKSVSTGCALRAYFNFRSELSSVGLRHPFCPVPKRLGVLRGDRPLYMLYPQHDNIRIMCSNVEDIITNRSPVPTDSYRNLFVIFSFSVHVKNFSRLWNKFQNVSLKCIHIFCVKHTELSRGALTTRIIYVAIAVESIRRVIYA